MDFFELLIDKKKFQNTNAIWNELKLNSPFSVGYVSSLIESRKFNNKEEWESFYYDSGAQRNSLIDSLKEEERGLLTVHFCADYKKINTNLLKINTNYGRTKECLMDKASILFDKVSYLGLTIEECFECVRYRVICETWNGIKIREQNTIKLLREKYDFNFVKTDGYVDYNFAVDYEVFKNEKLVCGIQIKPKSYLSENSYVKKANFINKQKINSYNKEKGAPVLEIFSDYSGKILNEEVLDFFNAKNKISIVNKKNHNQTDKDFYIGRGSPLGNPFSHIYQKETKAEFICQTRDEAIEKYKKYIIQKIKNKDKIICDELNRIWLAAKEHDINLVCYCFPQSCHGNYIKNIIESKL